MVPVSVIIPTYNSGNLVTQAIDSVLAQTVVPAEILVVDDGSADDTRPRLERYAGRVRYLHQANQGVSAARNHGVRAATREFVAFLDADDVWHPRKIELQLDVLRRRPELGLLGAQQFDWPARRFPELTGEVRVTDIPWERLVVRNYLNTSAIVARREALQRAGTFDPSIQGPEDRDLWLRVAEAGPVANIELPLTGYRDVVGSVSKKAARCRDGMLRILHKLDQRGAWQGRRLLRRKAYSYVYHSCAYIFAAAEDYPAAAACSLRSLRWYPLPYRRAEVTVAGERPRRLLVNLLRWLRLKPADRRRPAEFAAGELDAVQRLALEPSFQGGRP